MVYQVYVSLFPEIYVKEVIHTLSKSPSGSLCPYYYMGGELHPLKYGSFYENKCQLFDMIKREQEFILKSSGQNNRRIWIDVYETILDDEVVSALAEHIQAIRLKIYKLCFVGCSHADKRKIIKVFRNNHMDIVEQMRFFSDAEEAKQWLVGET